MSEWPVDTIRGLFPAFHRQVDGQPAVYFDGPAGSQVPQAVADAVSRYLLTTNANRGAAHATAVESDELLENAHQVLADFLGASDPSSICFGANMTSITLSVSRALSRLWKPGDEIILSRLDHDANVTPWELAARDAGVTVRYIELNPEEWTLNLDSYRSALSEKTKLVAFGYASNATGTINPVGEMIRMASSVGATTYVDAVHFAPHGRIDVEQLNCDFLVCSAYKFFGPHVGVLYGRSSLLNGIRPYKLRPSPESLPGKWMTGTQNHEGIAGAVAAVEYLASLSSLPNEGVDEQRRRERLDSAFDGIVAHERKLSEAFLELVESVPGIRVHGISDRNQISDRVPTFSLTHPDHSPQELADRLAGMGIFCWAGNHYALPFTEAAGLEPQGTLRIGALHYNTLTEVARAVDCLRTCVVS